MILLWQWKSTVDGKPVEATFTAEQAADRLVKRHVAKDVPAALALLKAGKPINLPAGGDVAEGTLTPVMPDADEDEESNGRD